MRRLLVPSDHNHLGSQAHAIRIYLRNSQIPGYSSRNNVYAMYLWHVRLFPKKCLRRICGSGVGVGELQLPLPGMRCLPCFYFWEKMPEESFFASGFGSGPSSPAAPGQFDIQAEHWKVREVWKSSNHNYKDGKQKLESQIQEAFWFFKGRWKRWLICQCLHVPLFKRGKVEVVFLEALEEIISALSLWLQKGKGRIWCWKSVLDLVMAFPCDIKQIVGNLWNECPSLFFPPFKSWICVANGSGPGCPAGRL